MPAYCPLCASDENTREERASDRRAHVVCTGQYHGTEPYVWEPTTSPGRRSRGDGLGNELDIWDKLLECISDGGPHSYGVVEDQLFVRYPTEAATIQERYGHCWRDGVKSTNQFSMSAYLAARLSELAAEGLLEKSFGPATGPWSYNGTISHWKRA